MPFRPERLRGLLKAKELRPDELDGVSRGMVAKWENGHAKPSLDALELLATALDVTTDYLLDRGDDYGGYEAAAACMAFDVFARDLTVTPEQRDRCRRALLHEQAPRTAKAWKAFSEMIDLAIGPPPPKFEVVTGKK